VCEPGYPSYRSHPKSAVLLTARWLADAGPRFTTACSRTPLQDVDIVVQSSPAEQFQKPAQCWTGRPALAGLIGGYGRTGAFYLRRDLHGLEWGDAPSARWRSPTRSMLIKLVFPSIFSMTGLAASVWIVVPEAHVRPFERLAQKPGFICAPHCQPVWQPSARLQRSRRAHGLTRRLTQAIARCCEGLRARRVYQDRAHQTAAFYNLMPTCS